jgi:PIN domain nuclease of toxin-antitoxin system
MPAVVADTHVLIWYLFDDAGLSVAASEALGQAAAAGDPIYVSAITLVEVTYLQERGRIRPETTPRLDRALREPQPEIVLVPVGGDIARALRLVPRDVVPEMPDRIIVATALYLNVPLVTRDQRMRLAQVETIW